MKKTNWIQTYSGIQFYPLEPDIRMVDIRDIAHGLANKCRFNGQCSAFYSVAEHSYHVSQKLSHDLALAGLLHDAAEAYLPDVPRPVKPHLRGFQKIEKNLLAVIFRRFDIQVPPALKQIKTADSRMCVTEGRYLMPDIKCWELKAKPYEDIRPQCWGPVLAEVCFIQRFRELRGEC